MIVRTRKLSDKALHGLAEKLLSFISDVEIIGQYAGGITFQSVGQLPLNIPNKANERLIEKIVVKKAHKPSDYIVFSRGRMTAPDPQNRHPEQHRFDTREPDAYFDEIALFEQHSRQNIPDYIRFSDEERLAVAREIGKFAAPVSEAGPSQSTAISQVLDQNLADLQRVTTEFLERSANAREQDEAAFREREAILQAEFEAKFSDLEKQRKALEDRRAELNDREPQHERRRLRIDLTQSLRETITNPPQLTGRRERSSNYLYLVAGGIFVAISVWLAMLSDVGLADGSAAFWARSLKSLVSGAAGAAFIWSGLSGLKTAAVASRDYEQVIQRYAFDMDRASWTVETILQMNAIEKTQVPDHWLTAVCQDLFVARESKRDENRSLDALAALMDVTAKARIGTNGLEFEVDRKGAKKISNERSDN